jgi:hypothetical protein
VGFRNTTIEFAYFFVQDRIAGIYLFLGDGRSSSFPMLNAITELKYQFVVRMDKPIKEAINISNGKSRM